MFEEIYGKLAVGYHRTNSQGMQALSQGQPFKLNDYNNGDFFGKGVYLQYHLKDQAHPSMQYAGDYLIKAKVNLEKFLIFEKEVYRKVYPGIMGVGDQLERVFRFPRHLWDRYFSPDLIERIKKQDSPDFNLPTSVGLAELFTRNSKAFDWVRRNTRGLVYSGDSQEGRAIVAFNPRSVIPMGYAHSKPGVSTSGLIFKKVTDYSKESMNPSLDSPRGSRDMLVRVPFGRMIQSLRRIPNGFISATFSVSPTSRSYLTLKFRNLPPEEYIEKVVNVHFPRWNIYSSGSNRDGTAIFVTLNAPMNSDIEAMELDSRNFN